MIYYMSSIIFHISYFIFIFHSSYHTSSHIIPRIAVLLLLVGSRVLPAFGEALDGERRPGGVEGGIQEEEEGGKQEEEVP
jgi:hypothetical protein